MEQSTPKEVVSPFYCSRCHNLDVFKLMTVHICVFKQRLAHSGA